MCDRYNKTGYRGQDVRSSAALPHPDFPRSAPGHPLRNPATCHANPTTVDPFDERYLIVERPLNIEARKGLFHEMRRSLLACCLATAGGALGAVGAMPAEEQYAQQKPLGRLTQLPGAASGQYLSCEETYGAGWETCGDQVRVAPPLYGESSVAEPRTRVADSAIIQV